MPEEFVTLATFNTPEEAYLLKIRLETEGIRVYLSGEAAVGMAWHLGIALGGVRLQVSSADVERAVAALNAMHAGVVLDEEIVAQDLVDDADADEDAGDCIDEDSRLPEPASSTPGRAAAPAEDEEPPTAVGDALATAP